MKILYGLGLFVCLESVIVIYSWIGSMDQKDFTNNVAACNALLLAFAVAVFCLAHL
jgi:hypothetical protein